MSYNIFYCCVYQAAADTFVNDFTWTHCVSCLFNAAWFIYIYTPTKQEKTRAVEYESYDIRIDVRWKNGMRK